MHDRQLRGDTAPHTEEGCDPPRTVRARDCDCVHRVLGPDPAIRPAYPSRLIEPRRPKTSCDGIFANNPAGAKIGSHLLCQLN